MAVMAASSSAVQPSLDRLKALDRLPDLRSQLQEAQQLCTHSARADMILKWLLEKLKKDVPSRRSAEAWNLLCSALRLLPTEGIARLLNANDFLTTVQTCLAEADIQQDSVLAVHASLKLLLELSEGERGAPIKALLSMNAAKAANFVGAWLTHAYKYISTSPEAAQAFADSGLLDPAIHIWTHRRRHAEDDAFFAQQCLLSGALLLTFLQAKDESTSLKRKRNLGLGRNDYTHVLESMLAKHIFLPVRTAFFKAQERSVKQQKNGEPLLSLEDKLAPLKANRSARAVDMDRKNGTIPVLLDVALRSVPTTTLKQRLKEHPWVEALFSALLECVAFEDCSTGRIALIDMLLVVDRRASLSTKSLSHLVDSYASLHHQRPNWALIATAIKLDPKIYLDAERASALYDAISEANLALWSSTSLDHTPDDAEALRLYDVWKHAIITPIMESYAKDRNLSSFIDLWHSQLKRDWTDVPWSVWFELDDSVRSLLEDSLSQAQIVEIVQRLHQSLSITGSDPQSALVLLQALISAIGSDELVDALHDELGSLFEDLLSVFDKGHNAGDANIIQRRHVWELLGCVFDRWYPSWAAAEGRSMSSVSELGSRLLQSKHVQEALKLSKVAQQASLPTEQLKGAAERAEIFVACVCSYFQHISKCLNAVKHALRPMVGNAKSTGLIQYPTLIDLFVDEDVYERHLQDYSDRAVRLIEEGNSLSTLLEDLSGECASAVSHSSNPKRREDMVRMAIQLLGAAKEKPPQSLGPRNIALHTLREIPRELLTRVQRGQITEAFLTDRYRPASDNLALAEQRLSIMIQHLEITEPVMDLLAQPEVVHNLLQVRESYTVASSVGHEWPSDIDPAAKVFEILEYLLRKITEGLVSREKQESGRKAMIALSDQVKRHILSSESLQGLVSEDPEMLLLVMVLISELEHCEENGVKEQFAYRTKKALSTYIDGLLESLGSTNIISRGKAGKGCSASQRMDALLSVPPQLLTRLGLETHRHRITAAVEVILGQASDQLAAFDGSLQSLAAVKSMLLTILRREKSATEEGYFPLTWYNTAGSLGMLAKDLLELDLGPREHATVETGFLAGMRRLDSRARLSAVDELSCRGLETSFGELRLLQCLLPALLKEDFDAQAIAPQSLPTRLLHIIAEAPKVLAQRREAMICLISILKSKPFMTTQYIIEETLATMKRIVSRSDSKNFLFTNVCDVLTALLDNHRSRLRDRGHLLIPLLQTLISYLFQVGKPADAVTLSRVLELLCKPPHLGKHAKTSDLVDEARKQQGQVGQYVQYVLHHYCVQILQGASNQGVREALRPGLWAMIKAIEVSDADGIKVLGAAMNNNSERAVLRSVYEEYHAVGK